MELGCAATPRAKGRIPHAESFSPAGHPAEDILAQASADGHVIVVTNDGLRVASHDTLRHDVPIEEVRRIQFDIEHDRPATWSSFPTHRRASPK